MLRSLSAYQQRQSLGTVMVRAWVWCLSNENRRCLSHHSYQIHHYTWRDVNIYTYILRAWLEDFVALGEGKCKDVLDVDASENVLAFRSHPAP